MNNIKEFHGWCLENFPFIEDSFDSLTDYQILCKIVEYLQETIKDVGNLENNYNELLTQVNELTTIVNTLNTDYEEIKSDIENIKLTLDDYDERLTANENNIESVNNTLSSLINANYNSLKNYIDQNLTLIMADINNIYNALPKVKATGISITLENTIQYKLDISLKPSAIVQDMVASKNLLELGSITPIINGIRATKNSDGSVHIEGTSTGIVSIILGRITFESNVHYILSGATEGSSETYYMEVQNISGSQNYNGDTEFVGTGVERNVRFRIPTSGISVDTTIYPMVRKASITDPTFEPYYPPTYGAIHITDGNNIIKVLNEDETSIQNALLNLGNLFYNKIESYEDDFVKQNGLWYIKKGVEKIESYNGESITTPYISSTGELSTGATIYYGVSNPTLSPLPLEISSSIDNIKNNLFSYLETTKINQVNNDLPFELEVIAVKKGDITNEI